MIKAIIWWINLSKEVRSSKWIGRDCFHCHDQKYWGGNGNSGATVKRPWGRPGTASCNQTHPAWLPVVQRCILAMQRLSCTAVATGVSNTKAFLTVTLALEHWLFYSQILPLKEEAMMAHGLTATKKSMLPLKQKQDIANTFPHNNSGSK